MRRQHPTFSRSKKFLTCFLLVLPFCVVAHDVLLIGHRGARGLAPENTLPGYRTALLQHVDMVDLDITMTQDGVLVVQHDLQLNPDITRDQKERWLQNPTPIVKKQTLKQLKIYDVGRIKPGSTYAALFPNQQAFDHTAIPTLKEVIHLVKQQAPTVGFQIEIKTDPTDMNSASPKKIAEMLATILKAEHILARTKVQSFDWRALDIIQTLNPAIQTAYLTDTDMQRNMQNTDATIAGQWTGGKLLKNYHDDIPYMIKTLGGAWWDAEDRVLSQANVQRAHQLGLKVAAWSWPERTGKAIDLPMVKKLLAMQVDAIITDRPDLVRPLIKEAGFSST